MVLALVLGFAAAARGDGAFPNAQSVLLPADRPNRIIVATTFGLVFSEDDGATWRYACESAATLNGRQYVVGPPPNDRIYGVSDSGVAVSADSACTWGVGGGALAGLPALDVFPDPSDSNVAFALALGLVDGLVSAYRSHDGGLSYEGPLFTAPADGQVTGIEPAASAVGIVYLTIGGPHPALARSVDGAATWTTRNIDLALANNANSSRRWPPSMRRPRSASTCASRARLATQTRSKDWP
ncbi:MAG: WD40/YVTN/BNR-like repeat-containing protein [Polyangia bacterium]